VQREKIKEHEGSTSSSPLFATMAWQYSSNQNNYKNNKKKRKKRKKKKAKEQKKKLRKKLKWADIKQNTCN
jgi:hypothetical protein